LGRHPLRTASLLFGLLLAAGGLVRSGRAGTEAAPGSSAGSAVGRGPVAASDAAAAGLAASDGAAL